MIYKNPYKLKPRMYIVLAYSTERVVAEWPSGQTSDLR